ncbi:hypothetical protein PBI_KALPINE_94 [Mycobacterium phage Kalpine]|nr:hypothetical protein PBI_KALPINE_94 [Mycobacterium phage Kalpine]
MSNPPNGLYRKAYDGSTIVRTADAVNITQGLRVYTNNLDRGTVDLTRAEFEWHAGENRYVLWFDVLVDTDYMGEALFQRRRVMQSDDRVATQFNGKAA